MKITKIYDSFVDYDDKELFMCRTNEGIKWFHRHEIPATILNPFIKRIKQSRAFRDKEFTLASQNERQCEVDKTDEYSADMKC